MRCISFLGSARPEKRRYCLNENCIETDIVQDAIFHLYHPDEILLFISDPRTATTATLLDSRNIPIRKIWIPAGTDEDQLWEIFSRLSGSVHDHEEILFDITNGCHSLPFLTFLVASYIQTVRNVTISGVIYAPHPGEFGFSRFVNLQPLMEVLDWIAGVKAFTSYTDAKPLHLLLSGMQADMHRSGTHKPPTHLIGWSHLLEIFCDAAKLTRPKDALYAARGILSDLPSIKIELEQVSPPLVPILNSLGPLHDIAIQSPDDGCTPEYLKSQLALIRYQEKNGLYLQAVSLSREVLVTGVMILIGISSEWLNADIRHEISRTLTGSALGYQGETYESTSYMEKVQDIKNWDRMVRIWIRVSDLRNDLAHCGMNLREERVRSLRKRASEVVSDVEEFFVLCFGDLISDSDKP